MKKKIKKIGIFFRQAFYGFSLRDEKQGNKLRGGKKICFTVLTILTKPKGKFHILMRKHLKIKFFHDKIQKKNKRKYIYYCKLKNIN